MNGVPESDAEGAEAPSASSSGEEDLLGRRIAAALVDLALEAAAFMLLAATLGESTVEGSSFSFELNGVEAGLLLVLVLLYHFVLEAATGQTVGKLLLGLRVVRIDAARPSTAAVAVRTLLRLVDWLPLLYLVGFITILATGRRRQRLGDLAAKTSIAQAAPVRHRGIAAAVTVLAVLGVLGFSFYRAADSEDTSASAEEGLSDLRVCADEAFDREAQECTEDQRGQPLSGRVVYCSAKVEAGEGEQFNGRILYEDEQFFTWEQVLPADASTVWLNVDAGEVLPGGEWECELSVGPEEVTASFEGASRVPMVAGIAVCPTTNTVPAGSTRMCDQDESGEPWGPTDSVTCSATVFGATGEVMRVDFVDLEGEEGLMARREIPGALAQFSAEFTGNPSFPAGDYACIFFLGGEQVGEKVFTISS